MRLRYIGLLALLTASAAGASNWVTVAESENGSTYEIDLQTISGSNGIKQFWVRAHYDPAIVKPGESNGYTALRRADCTDMSFRDLQTAYTRDGVVSNVTGQDDQVRFAAPDSVARGILDAVCGH